MGVERSTFVIDADGTVTKIMRQVKPDTHAADVLAALYVGATDGPRDRRSFDAQHGVERRGHAAHSAEPAPARAHVLERRATPTAGA